jgi:CRISPR-associated protein Cmr5
MSKQKIESYIPAVMEVLKEKFPKGEAPKEFNGYISSFGASIIQSGLKATVALFENQQANTEADRSCLTKIILEVLGGNEKNLLDHILNNSNKEDILKEEIVSIAVAIKLSLRTFELKKGLKNVNC